MLNKDIKLLNATIQRPDENVKDEIKDFLAYMDSERNVRIINIKILNKILILCKILFKLKFQDFRTKYRDKIPK